MARSLRPILLAVFLAGCAHDATVYPSLAPRAIEKTSLAEPVTTPLVAQPDPALDGAIAQKAAALAAIVKGFDADAAVASRAAQAARGAAAGSEPWLTAQQALAALDDWRAQGSALNTDIEQLAIDRAAKLQPVYPALAALQAQAGSEAQRQSATIDRLQAALPRG